MKDAFNSTANQKAEWFIYRLRDSNTRRVRYIGFTKNPKNRLHRHLVNARGGRKKLRVYEWLREELDQDRKPLMEIIHYGYGEWKNIEAELIESYRSFLPDLLNMTLGRHVPIPAESRKRAGQKRRGVPFTKEHCAAISAAKKGKPRPDRAEITARALQMAERNRGKKMVLSENERARRSLAGKKSGSENFRKMWDEIRRGERIAPQARAKQVH